jgi:CheY-like chemotaxis protein
MRAVVADDSSIVRDRVGAYLTFAGHVVVGSVANGKEAYEMCLRERPDIAIFDVSMPVMNGDVAGMRVMKERLARFVILASSQVQEATLAPALAAGCHVIAKPFYREKFVRELAEIIGGPR